MSEKTKTPREMADLYCKDFDPHDYGIGEIAELVRSTYLTALEAGARMGWDKGRVSGRISEFNYNNQGSEVGELSFDEWWASLEKINNGEKK